jgi:tetratricopeptide (TPR) repeat protein
MALELKNIRMGLFDNRIIRTLCLAFLILVSPVVEAQFDIRIQNLNADSLISLIPEKEGAELVEVLNLLSNVICKQNTDSSLRLAKQAINLSEELEYKKGLADAYLNLGNEYLLLDTLYPSFSNYLKAFRIYENLDPSQKFGDVCMRLGDLNYFTGRFEEALPYYWKAINIYNRIDDVAGEVEISFCLALIHLFIKDYDSSLYYNRTAISLLNSSHVDNTLLAYLYNHFTNVYYDQFYESGDTAILSKAFPWLLKGLDLPNIGDYIKAGMTFNTGSFSLEYKTGESIATGIEYLNKAISIAESCKEASYNAPAAYRRMGRVKYWQGDYDSALLLFNKSLELLDKELSNFSIIDYKYSITAYISRYYLKNFKKYTHYNLYQVYSRLGDNELALEHYIQYTKAKDEVYLKQNQDLIAVLEAEAENEKTEKQIALLARDNELNKMKVAQSRAFNFGVAALFVILLLVGFLFLRQNKLKNEHKSTLLEQKLLRLQMNPHFIFNAFSNILRLIDTNENKQASIYLTTFGKLLRTTLESTREDMVPFEKEVSTLRNYLELQKLRYAEKFEYSLEVDEKIDQEDMSIPPMLVQPFIENAIEHGIRHKKSIGRIDVRFILKGKKILCEVEDDGVGREKAWEAEYAERGDRKSLATEIIIDRIKVLNKKFKQKIRLEIIDKQSTTMKALGTKVVIDLPWRTVY